jgi:hypothetical protein
MGVASLSVLSVISAVLSLCLTIREIRNYSYWQCTCFLIEVFNNTCLGSGDVVTKLDVDKICTDFESPECSSVISTKTKIHDCRTYTMDEPIIPRDTVHYPKTKLKLLDRFCVYNTLHTAHRGCKRASNNFKLVNFFKILKWAWLHCQYCQWFKEILKT